MPLPSLPDMLVDAGVGLRTETADDRAFLIDLYAEQRRAEVAAMPWSAIDKVRFLADQFRLQEAHYATHRGDAKRWIVTRGAVPIGRLYLARGPGDWELVEIGLVAAARGRGLGSALVDLIVADAAVVKAAVALQVMPDNVGAIALYRRKGFRPTGRTGAGRIGMRRVVS